MVRTRLLACGLVASLLYLAMNVFVPLVWPTYSSLSQTISELSAVDAPTRPIWVPLGLVYALLVAAFGLGVVQTAGASRAERVLGWMLVINGILSLVWPPMHQREVLAAGGGTLTDTLHLVWAGLTMVLMVGGMFTAMRLFGRPFLVYTVVTLVLLVIFGGLTSRGAPAVAANLPTPWLGVWERINVLGYMAWQGVLSLLLVRRAAAQPRHIRVSRGVRGVSRGVHL